jgi:hypothetical protein
MDPTTPTPLDDLAERAARMRVLLARLAPGDPRTEEVRVWLRDFERYQQEAVASETAVSPASAAATTHPTETAQPASADDPSCAVIRCLADVQPSTVQWLDPARIALGTLTVFDGDPGVGKTTVALDYAARVSTGRDMPDGTRGDLYAKPAGVVVLSAEDDPATTLRPKLEAMGADLQRIVLLEGVRVENGARMPNLGDLAALEDAIKRVDARLVIVDPLMAYLPSTRNSYRDQDMRAVLTPLIGLVARLSVALLVVRHLTKSTGETGQVNALYRGGGSIGIAGAARSVLLIAPDRSDASGQRRILVRVKGNLSQPPTSLAFHLDGPEGGVATVAWEGATYATADDLLGATNRDNADEPSRLEEACDFLRERLADGPVPAGELLAMAVTSGISEITLRRAKKAVGVRHAKLGMRGPWAWLLPGASGREDGAA